jgi:hypothetical protein
MYGLPQTGILSNHILAQLLALHGYHQTRFTPGMWQYITHPIKFSLVVDDVGVQDVGNEHARHLSDALEKRRDVYAYW